MGGCSREAKSLCRKLGFRLRRRFPRHNSVGVDAVTCGPRVASEGNRLAPFLSRRQHLSRKARWASMQNTVGVPYPTTCRRIGQAPEARLEQPRLGEVLAQLMESDSIPTVQGHLPGPVWAIPVVRTVGGRRSNTLAPDKYANGATGRGAVDDHHFACRIVRRRRAKMRLGVGEGRSRGGECRDDRSQAEFLDDFHNNLGIWLMPKNRLWNWPRMHFRRGGRV